MKKKLSNFIISNLLTLVSAIIASIAATICFSNINQNINHYIDSLTSNPYESYIIESSGLITDEIENDKYFNELDSCFGEYSKKSEATIDTFSFDSYIVKSHAYKDDKQYNNFGVLASIVNESRQYWSVLNESNCFISRRMSLLYASTFHVAESSILGKKIVWNGTELTIAGVYFTNTNSDNPNELKSKGNAFTLHFDDAIFVSESTMINCEFSSFLYLYKNGKNNAAEMYTFFKNACKDNNYDMYMKDSIGSYHIDKNTQSKINSIYGFYSAPNRIIGALLFIVSIACFVISVVFSNKANLSFYGGKFFINTYLLIPALFITVGILIIRIAFVLTNAGLKIVLNNPASIVFFSIIMLLYSIISLRKAIKKYLIFDEQKTIEMGIDPFNSYWDLEI